MSSSDTAVIARIAHAWRELRRTASTRPLRAHLTGDSGPTLEQGQLDSLEVITASDDGWKMTDFADAMRVDPSNATRAIDRLEALGLAERTRDDDDRRIVVVTATDTGRRTMADVEHRRTDGMSRLLAGFEPHELEQFADYLERLVAAIDDIVDDVDDH